MTAERRRRVLVLAYYFPPMGLSGVQRTAKFVKYLPECGWDVTVLTVEPGGYFAFDEGLLEELDRPGIHIVRTSSVDPTRFFSPGRGVALPRESRRRTFSNLSQWIFLPDNKIGWVPFAVRQGSKLLSDGGYDAIFSSAPPYSSHLAAGQLARRHRLPLVLDYRDDWLDNPRHIYPTGIHRWAHGFLERRALQSADALVTINRVIAGALQQRCKVPVALIPQGFDWEDYPVREGASAPGADQRAQRQGRTSEPGLESPEGGKGADGPQRMRLVYAGVFYDRQTPIPFLESLYRLLRVEPGLRSHVEAQFVGLFPEYAHRRVAELELEDVVSVLEYRTHREAMAMVSAADVAWLTVGSGEGQDQISTGKLYAYMGAERPILGIVPEGAAADTLAAYGASWVAHPDRPDEIDAALSRAIRLWLEGRLPVPDPNVVGQFDRANLTRKLAAVLEEVTS